MDEEGKENFKAKLGEYDEKGENADFRKDLANLLIDHSIGQIVDKFEGSTAKLMQRLIEWFVSGKQRVNSAKIVLNGNEETRKKYLVEFFIPKMRSDIIEEMEKREKDIKFVLKNFFN